MGKSNSGKNTLLYSLLNETILGKGEMVINGKISLLTPKFPSIVPGTLRDNILLGSKFYGKMYHEVVSLLKLDTSQFPGGDLVEVLPPP
jgi:ABC-type polysaccharide/polyol phosphate transport system ATPase subunit